MQLITFDQSVFLLYPWGSFRAISKSWTVILERNARQTWRAMHFYFHHFPLPNWDFHFCEENVYGYRVEPNFFFFFFALFCFLRNLFPSFLDRLCYHQFHRFEVNREEETRRLLKRDNYRCCVVRDYTREVRVVGFFYFLKYRTKGWKNVDVQV